MKTIYTYLKRVVLAGCMLAGAAAPTFAQWDSSKAHLIVDWQMNAPFSTGYADKISGWGMNFEGLYDVTPRWSVGAFVMYHTNHRYICLLYTSNAPCLNFFAKIRHESISGNDSCFFLFL